MKEAKVFSCEKPVPVILGCYVNGLGLIRSFGEMDIPTIGLDLRKEIGMYSKYTRGFVCPDPVKSEQGFIDYLITLGNKLKNKGALFATNDIWLIPICKNSKKLSEYFKFPMSEWAVIKKCMDKSQLYKAAEKNGIPIPKTFFLNSVSDVWDIKNEIIFPCVLKPSITIGFLEKLKSNGRTLIINDLSDLKFWSAKIEKAKLGKQPLLIQEQIPGETENLYTLTAYSNVEAEVVAYSVGHKIRQYPPDAGTILSGRVKNEQTVFRLGKKLIKSLGFYGISNTEFKRDNRDGSFKLIEINPRPGMWTYSATAHGLNLPYIAYQELMGKKFSGPLKSMTGKVWLRLLDDFYNSMYGYAKSGYQDKKISLKEWLRSINGKKIYAINSLKDPFPGIAHTTRFFTSPFRKRMKKE